MSRGLSKSISKFFTHNILPSQIKQSLVIPKNIPIQTNYLSNIDDITLNKIQQYKNNVINVPIVINGNEYKGDEMRQLCPYDTSKKVCYYYYATDSTLDTAIKSFEKGKNIMKKLSVDDKITIFNNLADLFTHEIHRYEILASTIFGQGKTIHQAEIDAVCELADFLNFNAYYFKKLITDQPYSTNSLDADNISLWNSLNGFIASITPFNFTAIGANLATAPLLMNNHVIWKPSDNAILSNYIFYKSMLEIGMPPEAVSFVPSEPSIFMEKIGQSKNLGGLAFTGSSSVFENIYKFIGNNISEYNSFPRIVGETGGMNYHFVFNDINKLDDVVLKTIRGAFEYSGQKCSATSRLYLPKSLSNKFIDKLIKELDNLKIDSPEKEGTFTSAVINKKAYDNISASIKKGKSVLDSELIYGGEYSDKIGYYIYPTIFMCKSHDSYFMKEETFGPVLGIYVYDDSNSTKCIETLKLCSQNKYALTGSIFTSNIDNVKLAEEYLDDTCGNYYVNDKCTGSVVFQQPFGGSKKSGTNDKAGSPLFLTRFGNNRIIKNFII